MAVLLLVYAFAMAYATFMENDYGTPTAKALIYEAKWFEVIMLLLIINFIGNIGRYRLWKREKWPLLVFHLAFVLIFIGGAITRYISYEGQMHIREGETSNEIVTDKNFFKIQIENGGDRLSYQEIPYMMSSQEPLLAKLMNHRFEAKYDFHGQLIQVKQLDYIQRKKDSLQVDDSGKNYLHLVSTNDSGREDIYLSSGEVKNINGFLISFDRPIEGAVEFKNENGNILIKTPEEANYMTMATQATGVTKKNEYQPLVYRSLYTIKDLKIVVPEMMQKGKLISYSGDKKKDQNVPDMLLVELKGPKTSQNVELSVEKGNPNAYKQVTIDGLNIILGFGPKVYQTPFALKLDDFVMETYPGSNSPSAYESHIQIIDEGKQTPYKIFMNHVLNHKGYRFFQASFDPDRQGTVLSVNHDFWGTLISYIGYALLFLGLFVTLFWKGTHFWKLNQSLKDMAAKKATVVLLLLSFLGFNAQDNHQHETVAPSSVATQAPAQTAPHLEISKEHAAQFAYLLVQGYDGRIEPMSTQALDVLRKMAKKEKWGDLNADQWFLSINLNPMAWMNDQIIKVGSSGGEELLKKTKANEKGYTSMMNLFVSDTQGMPRFILEDDFNTAFRKKPAEQSKYDLEVIAINERVQIFYGILSGQYFRIIPIQNDPNHTWNSWLDQEQKADPQAQNVIAPYFLSVIDATKNNDWAKANAELEKVKEYQKTWGKSVIPDESKINIEVLLNTLNLNFYLLIFYTLIGGLLIILGFIELFKPSKILHKIIKIIIYLGVIGYVFHFLGLIARWYISGHAPWSNGYEAIVFISWVGITAGLMLYRNSNALIPSAGFMVAVIMMGFAHGTSQLDPQITPLVPVLKSYWLIVHVAIIVSSYGFFALSMIIAVISLFFYIISDKKSYQTHNGTTLKELTIVSEMSLTIGLLALVIGVFLGGVWANESWGRYWSWDPKETWAFISTIVYAFVLHMRLVPGLRGRWAYHVAAMFAFCSMVMTYFGVNYYLTGLHSYAAGDPIPVPAWVYISLVTMTTLSVWAYFKFKKLNS
ncbi:cytochrome c biogenesis protein [Cloacibacterium rupense]|uniref:Cytochrome c biogenesis protein n=2 Tax=Cloacibacterium rupense TaxID=517423 RepID=A0ABQ2NJW2_9FLAO|nr:cytochrome c biogenesis protein [Cloacibacterium rupense]